MSERMWLPSPTSAPGSRGESAGLVCADDGLTIGVQAAGLEVDEQLADSDTEGVADSEQL